jgi:hypothetical protein
MTKIALKSIIYPTIIILIVFLLNEWTGKKNVIFHEKKWIVFLVLMASTLATNFVTDFGIQNNPKKFTIYYFFSMFVRVIIFLIFVFSNVYLKINHLFLFLITCFFCYFLYLIFEIYFLLHNLRRNFKIDS